MDLSSSFSLRDRILRFIRGQTAAPSRADSLWTEVHRHQLRHDPVFRRWCGARQKPAERRGAIFRATHPPACLPVIAFKETCVCSFRVSRRNPWFESSGTTSAGAGMTSRHHFRSLDLYERSVIEGWKWQLQIRNSEFGIRNWAALMPSFDEKPHSSLSCMAAILMREFGDGNGFWCMTCGKWNWSGFRSHLNRLKKLRRPAALFGTAFAWVHFLDWCAARQIGFLMPAGSMILETGGYKGRSREIERTELHRRLRRLFGVKASDVHSEYSMCELSSQAYSFQPEGAKGEGRPIFRFPPWCRHRVVQPGSSISVSEGETGVLEIHDLANLDSCAFLRTEDMAIRRGDGFELIGRLPRAGLKGCSLAFEDKD
ncbi:MAG: hypothetical protein HY360_03895 [Verrucomicrobia bacterium]|nr:hypothetical protein [Verrucomicrobiota bacterium]